LAFVPGRTRVNRSEGNASVQNDDNRPNSAEWLEPPSEHEGLARYVETIRERWKLILLGVLATTAVAVFYVQFATKMYEADSDLLVTPVSSDNTTLTSLGLLRDSTDPTQPIETAARLATSTEVADIAREKLGAEITSDELLEQVTAEPVAGSNIIALTATSDSPEEAKQIANAFAEGIVTDRTEKMHEQIEATLPDLEAQLSESPTQAVGPETLSSVVTQLQTLQNAPDPTIRVETLAEVPDAPASPKPLLSIIGGIIAGLALGIGAAFAAQVLDPRLRRETQLRRLYRLPILARIPRESRALQGKPLNPRNTSPVTSEAYRILRSTVQSRGKPGGGAKTTLITGPSPAEGKTSTAVGLAVSLALSGSRVILIESDLRRPTLGEVLQTSPERGGVVSVLVESVSLDEALTTTALFGPNLRVLLADYEGGGITELFSLPAAARMLEEAKQLADYVIIDSPPLNEDVDALPLARAADEVLNVVRLGQSRLNKIAQLGELLAENGIRPSGFAVVGTPRPRRGEYHYFETAEGERKDAKRRRLIGPTS
jgi:capsular exopolysaccharide synthesis family protein